MYFVVCNMLFVSIIYLFIFHCTLKVNNFISIKFEIDFNKYTLFRNVFFVLFINFFLFLKPWTFEWNKVQTRHYPIMSYPVLSCSIQSYPVLSCPILSDRFTYKGARASGNPSVAGCNLNCPYPVLSYESCPIMSYPVLSYASQIASRTRVL